MNIRFVVIFFLSSLFTFQSFAQTNLAPHPTMSEDTDGDLKSGEYIVISPNGSITRSICPYTCEMRGLPKDYCKTWKSITNEECYVQDTRISSGAMPGDTLNEVKKSNDGYK